MSVVSRQSPIKTSPNATKRDNTENRSNSVNLLTFTFVLPEISEKFQSFMQASRGLVGGQQSAHTSTRKRSTYFHFSVQFNTVKTGGFDSSSSFVVPQACQRTKPYRTSTASIDQLNAFLSSGSRRKVRKQLSRNFRVSITSPLNA